MRHNVKEELRQSMDALRFSEKDKEEMTNMLLKNAQKPSRSRGGRKLLVVALAAALALLTLTGAGLYTRWSRSMQGKWPLGEQQKQTAEKSGLSTMLDGVSATDQGITITALQSLVDKDRAHLIFRIDGFEQPDPYISGFVDTIGGTAPSIAGWTSSFYRDSDPEDDDMGVYAEDGSLEYHVELAFTSGEHLGKEIVVRFTSLGTYEGQDPKPKMDPKPLVEGDWTLKWTLTGVNETRSFSPNSSVGDSGFTLLTAELSNLSIRMTMTGDRYAHPNLSGAAHDPRFPLPHEPALAGFRMEDGSFLSREHMVGGMGGTRELEPGKFEITADISVADISQVKGVLFYNMDDPEHGPMYEVDLQ